MSIVPVRSTPIGYSDGDKVVDRSGDTWQYKQSRDLWVLLVAASSLWSTARSFDNLRGNYGPLAAFRARSAVAQQLFDTLPAITEEVRRLRDEGGLRAHETADRLMRIYEEVGRL